MESTGPPASNGLEASLEALRIGSSSGTPQHAMPGVSQPQALKKQLFGAEDEGSQAPRDEGNEVLRENSSMNPDEGTVSADKEDLQGRAATSAAGESGTPVPASAAESSPCTPPMPETWSKPPPPDLKVVLDPRRYSAAAQAMCGPAAGMVGMSPGARAFAPPFGARFGDRGQARVGKAGEDAEGMERVREEQEGAAEEGSQGRDEESTSDSAVPAADSAGSGGDLGSLDAPADGGPSSASAVAATAPQASTQEVHAPRVATTATSALGRTGSEGASSTVSSSSQNRPRLRMAVEGKRDDLFLAGSDSSKFAPTPKTGGARPRDGPWQP